MQHLIDIALEMGIRGFKADVLGQNKKMMHVFHECGYPLHSRLEDGVYIVRVDFSEKK